MPPLLSSVLGGVQLESYDVEGQHAEIDLDPSLIHNIPKPTQHQRFEEVFELDEIPPIVNYVWDKAECVRQKGLASAEAGMFLTLLQEDQLEAISKYEEYKAMLDGFQREKERLIQVVQKLKWFNILLAMPNGKRRANLKARIQWLERMQEPRLWLLYLMARRRRILHRACLKLLSRLKEKNKGGQELIEVSPGKPSSHINKGIEHPRPRATKPAVSIMFDPRYSAVSRDIIRQVKEIMPVQEPYFVIGYFVRSTSHPREKQVYVESAEDFFKNLRRGERQLRGFRKVFSLKGLRGFSLYKCDLARGSHFPMSLKQPQEAVLSQLFLAYRSSWHYDDVAAAKAWYIWVRKNLNNDNDNLLEGRYSLQLKYGWSSYRLTTLVIVPLVLSLTLGIWYMKYSKDVGAAWTVGSYIVTSAAALIALMTIVGGFNDI